MASPQPPHIENAGRWLPTLVTSGLVFADAGLLVIAAGFLGDAVAGLSRFIAPPTLGLAGSSLLVAACGFVAAALLAYARQQLADGSAEAPPPIAEEQGEEWPDPAGRRHAPRRPPALALDRGWIARWPPALATVILALLAAVGVVWSWPLPGGSGTDPSSELIAGGALILCAFPVLVLERLYAGADANLLPEAPQLQWLLRVPLTALLGLGLSTVLLGVGFAWPVRVEQAIGVLILLVAAELLLRAAATLFLPFAPLPEARSVAESTVAGVLRFRPLTLKAVSGAVEKQFGIDLSRSWAIGFVARAAFPVAIALGLLAWGLSGVTALGLDQRAIYQRFGVPAGVLGPGLHIGLPWPFGLVRRVEFGVLHEVPVAVSDATLAGGLDDDRSGPPPLPPAEAPAPPTSDRLWDGEHPSEATYLVASESRGKSSFQSVSVNVSLIWRTGLTDAAAMAAAYRVDDPERLVRAAAGQLLARYFASHTLLGVLGADRETFGAEFRAALQSELDRLSTGLEIVAVIVEAIHPPPGAANAYHNVQAAEINAKVAIADETGAAFQRTKAAATEATRDRDEAAAAAAETLAKADAERQLFDADDTAYRRDGQAFLLERWFDRVRTALRRTELVVLDHRLDGARAPTIDLRDFAPPAATPP